MKVRLGDYIREYSVRNKENKDIPVYSVTNTQGFCKDYFGKEVASKDKTTYKIVPKGYFAYNPSRINVGSVDWQKEEEKVIVSPLYNVFSVAEEIEQQYLYYYLKSDITLQRIRAVSTGSVRDNLKLNMLYEFPINLPTKEEQRYIVKILDRARQVIELRKKEVDMLNDLINARFVEMFGDLKTNSKRWDIKSFDEISSLITDGEHATPKRDTYGIHLLSARNVLNHSLQLDDVDYINEDEYDRIAKRVVPQEGDVLISCSGTVGRCCSVPADFKFQMVRSVALIRFNKVVNPIFAEYMITSNYLQEQINSSKTSSSQANLFQGKIKALKGFLPPIELQNQFADFVKGVGKSKVAVRKALEETQLLFDSLMQQYFG